MQNELYDSGPKRGTKARYLITHLDGALDAGSAGGLAVRQLLRSLDAQRVATFRSDELIDYRSHRPTMQVENWVTTGLETPEIAVDLVHDDSGTPVLVLHGPEPDARWHKFTDAIMELAAESGVEVMVSLHGLPAAVPHTRPSAIHVQSTDKELIPDQPLMGGIAQFPAPYTSFLQHHAAQRGLTGITLLATVPYYMAGSTFPRASSALLRRLSDIAELSLPVGDLERGADEETSQVDKLVEHNQDLQSTVDALERHFDDVLPGRSSAESAAADLLGHVNSLGDWESVMRDEPADGEFPEAERVGDDDSASLAETIGEAIEKYLKIHSKRKHQNDAPTVEATPGDPGEEDGESETN